MAARAQVHRHYRIWRGGRKSRAQIGFVMKVGQRRQPASQPAGKTAGLLRDSRGGIYPPPPPPPRHAQLPLIIRLRSALNRVLACTQDLEDETRSAAGVRRLLGGYSLARWAALNLEAQVRY
jgi:hypothetical protein